MARGEPLDRELADLPAELRWREWMARIEAVLFASSEPVAPEVLARVIGQAAPLGLLIDDLRAELAPRACELVHVGAGWMLRTRPRHAAVLHAAALGRPGPPPLREEELAVLAAIAFHQPITRDGLKDIFGREIPRDLTRRLTARRLIAPGPRAPSRGAPHTFVTTQTFLTTFGMESLEDLAEDEP